MNFFDSSTEQGKNYIKLLKIISKLSGLFSDSITPYINYRVAENIFCKSFNAENLSRSDTAFDAKINGLGIGLKTFICNNNSSFEKVAEFNALSNKLRTLKGIELATELATYRNERILLAKRLYNINKSFYHIVARKERELILFNTDYDTVNLNNIKLIKEKKSSLYFEDGTNSYSFNFSKSTLFRKFDIPESKIVLPIEILEDPYALLLQLFESKALNLALKKATDYVILPLYGKQRKVYEKSGLNQWNASGRARDFGETYIPIPIKIHQKFPDFFPLRDTPFNLEIPTGEVFTAKVCQDNSKALMTSPNKALSEWLLRNVLELQEGELATIEKLDILGFDSVMISKLDSNKFKIDVMKTGSYEKFINL